MRLSILLLILITMNACHAQMKQIQTGADQMGAYISLLEHKNIAIVANQTSEVNSIHLVDTLLSYGEKINIVKVFAPEHGFRGNIDDGVVVNDEMDVRTGLPIVSLYGKYKQPSAEVLQGIDLIIFDIQDVGTRFYTFISTMHYVMEACAENNVKLLILDRPNPNGNYIDGPLLKSEFQSFVGMHPIPVVHGLTVGELAQMINGEGWLSGGAKCDISIIPCKNYTHAIHYELPVKPSPNLPNDHTIRLYPSTCFFEGTEISEGRGTLYPFRIYGHPDLPGEFSFVPESIEGMEMSPKFKGQVCYGNDLREFIPEDGWNKLHLEWVIDAYQNFPEKDKFFHTLFDLLAGTDQLRKQITAGMSQEQIRKSWQNDLEKYKKMRQKYLIYEP